MTVRSLSEIATAATARFATFTDKMPHLIPTGLRPLDEEIGGLSPGMIGLMAIARGVGKSSTALSAGYASPARTGVVSLEDPEAEVGIRLLSLKTGINGLLIRKKQLDAAQKKLLSRASAELKTEDGLLYAFRVGGGVEAMENGIDELGEAGCEMIWVDYAQCPNRGAERSAEVSQTFSRAAERIAKWNAAGIILSQITDDTTSKGRPKMAQVRHSRDLIDAARIVIMGWRNEADTSLIHYSLDKSMVGSDGFRWAMRRDSSGTLREITAADDFAEEW